jgi:hypothetical protein
MLEKFVVCPKNFFRPLKWYTLTENFFGDGGGGGRQEKLSPENFLRLLSGFRR